MTAAKNSELPLTRVEPNIVLHPTPVVQLS